MNDEARPRRLAELYRELADVGDVADREAHMELSARYAQLADEIRHRTRRGIDVTIH